MAKTHTNSTDSQNRFTTETINPQNSWNSSDKHDDTDDSSGQETGGVAAQTKLLKDLWSIVEDLLLLALNHAVRDVVTYGIDTSPLLKEHSNCCYNNTLKHGLCLEQRSNSNKLKLNSVASSLFLKMRELLCQTPLLKQGLSLDFEEFKFDKFVVGRKVT